jgi:hypothetical protein
VLVAIEMFNAFNALSEDNSLLQLPPWSNPWLLLATAVSLGLHAVILYVPFLAKARGTLCVCVCVRVCACVRVVRVFVCACMCLWRHQCLLHVGSLRTRCPFNDCCAAACATPDLPRPPALNTDAHISTRARTQVFSIVPLSLDEWLLVLLFALPVILIDEVLKMLGRRFFGVKHVVPHRRASQLRSRKLGRASGANGAAAGGDGDVDAAADGKLKAA